MVAFAMFVGLALGAWQGLRLGRVKGQQKEYESTLAFLSVLIQKKEETPLEDLRERVAAFEHRNYHYEPPRLRGA